MSINTIETNKIQINTETDNFNLVLHGLANAATCVGVAYVTGAPLLLTAAAFAVAGIYSYSLEPEAAKDMYDTLPATEREKLPWQAHRLPEFIAKAARDLGMKKTPKFYLVEEPRNERVPRRLKRFKSPQKREEDEEKRKKRFEMRSVLYRQMGRSLNAFAYGLEFPGVVATKPLLEELSSDENEAVIAHEMGHIAAKHTTKQKIVNMPGAVARTVAEIEYLSNWHMIYALSAEAIAELTAKFIAGRLNLDPKGKKVQAFAQGVGFSAFWGTLYATGIAPVAQAWAVAKAVTLGTRLIEASFSRCNELQADRISAEYTRKPQDLSNALTKIDNYSRENHPDSVAGNHSRRSALMRALTWAESFFWSHPHPERRYAALREIGRELQANSLQF